MSPGHPRLPVTVASSLHWHVGCGNNIQHLQNPYKLTSFGSSLELTSDITFLISERQTRLLPYKAQSGPDADEIKMKGSGVSKSITFLD